MIDAMKLINTIISDWWLLIAFFTAGGVYWQLKHWFEKVNASMSYASAEHKAQNEILNILHTKVASIEVDVAEIKRELTAVHEEVHDQEVKLAVLETKRPAKRRQAQV